jgi:hypothetical protein
MFDHLLPRPGVEIIGHDINGVRYIQKASLVHMLTTMELNNRASPQGKPEWTELLVYLRTTIANINWSRP